MSRGFKIALGILLPLVMLIVGWWPWSPGGRQYLNMRVAARNLGHVKAIVDADPRFAEVTVYVFTGQDGALAVGGQVKTNDDLCELMRAVGKERVPITLVWHVDVRP